MSLFYISKRKGNRRCCDNYPGISLLWIAGNILAQVLLNRLPDHLESGILPESKWGRSTVDMTFAARQLQEKCWEQHQDLYTTFVGLMKAFDTVSHAGLWKIMAKYGCPDTFKALVCQFHDGMLVQVKYDGDSSEPVAVTNGVKQGCVRGGPLDIQGGARFFPPCANILFLPASNGKLFFSKDTYNQTSFFWRHIKSNILFFITIHML